MAKNRKKKLKLAKNGTPERPLVEQKTPVREPAVTKEAAAKDGERAAKKAPSNQTQKFNHAQTFASAVGVLMRAPEFRMMPIAALETILLPPLVLGQCRVGYGNPAQSAPPVPIALALWARVSKAVDARLSTRLDKPIELKPADWSSGDNLWLVTVAGDPKAVPTFLERIYASEFIGKKVKMRVKDQAGKVVVAVLGVQNVEVRH